MIDEFSHANRNLTAWPVALLPADLSLLERRGRWKKLGCVELAYGSPKSRLISKNFQTCMMQKTAGDVLHCSTDEEQTVTNMITSESHTDIQKYQSLLMLVNT